MNISRTPLDPVCGYIVHATLSSYTRHCHRTHDVVVVHTTLSSCTQRFHRVRNVVITGGMLFSFVQQTAQYLHHRCFKFIARSKNIVVVHYSRAYNAIAALLLLPCEQCVLFRILGVVCVYVTN